MVPDDVLRMVYGLLSLVPLSFIIPYIKNKTARYAYNLIIALSVQFFVYEDYMYPIYVQHCIAYLLIKVKGPRCGALLTIESMAFLSGYHIYEYVYNYGGWTMNASALLMILVCKYSLLAYNIEDGAKEHQHLTKEQQHNKIMGTIGFLDFLGYVNFLPTSLIGPALEYNDYKDFMELSKQYSNIPSVLKISFKTLGQTILFAVIYILGDIYVPLSELKVNSFYNNSFGYVLLYASISVYMLRCKYYFGWKLSMISVHSSGVSYTGHDFRKINTVNPWVFETNIHVREKISHWNISVQQWLRKSIYERSPFKSKTINQLYVFLVSAFWHGFYSAYYISFILWFAQVHLQSLIFKYCQNDRSILVRWYKKSGAVGHGILSFLVMFLFSHSATYFLVLNGDACFMLMSKLYYLPQIILFGLIAIFTIMPVNKVKREHKHQIVHHNVQKQTEAQPIKKE